MDMKGMRVTSEVAQDYITAGGLSPAEAELTAQIDGLGTAIAVYGPWTKISNFAAYELLAKWSGDYEIKRQNGLYFRVTLFEPSYEHIGEDANLPAAVLAAARKALARYDP